MRWLSSVVLYALSALIGFKAGAGLAVELHRNQSSPKEALPRLSTTPPRLGAAVVLPKADVLGGELPEDGLVVFLGQCSSCSLRAIQPASVRPVDGKEVVILYDGVATDASKALAKALPRTHRLVYVPSLKGIDAFENVAPPAAVFVKGGRAVRVHTEDSPLFEVVR